MLHERTPMTDALFGMFLQDIREMEKRNPRCFGSKYYQYSYAINEGDKFGLVVQPDSFPKEIEKEVKLSFHSRLNGDVKKYNMKKVLIATDFSEASSNATRYGAVMADELNARVVLFNAYQQVPIPVADALVFVTPQDMGTVVQEQLEREVDEIMGEKIISIEIQSKEGPSVKAILDTAKEMDADLIIAGMKGKGRALRRILGSTVTALAKETTIPLLIIPEGISYSSPKVIALASDVTPAMDTHTLEILRAIAEASHPKFYIVRVVGNRSDEKVEISNGFPALESLAGSLDPVYEYPFDKNVPHALSDFVLTHHVDILAIMPRRHSLSDKLLRRSTTKDVILQVKIPLLILPAGR